MQQSSSSASAAVSERILSAVYSGWGIVVAGLVISFSAPLTASLWLDEAISAWVVSSDVSKILRDGLEYQSHSPFYFLVLWAWQHVAGNSELALRAPSILSGVLTVILVFRIGRLLWDRELGAWAGLLLLSNESFLKSTLSARPYALALMFSVASVWLLLEWLRSSKLIYLVACALCTVLAFYAQYFFAGVGLVHVWFVWKKSRQSHRMLAHYLYIFGVAALLALPGLRHLLFITSRQGLYTFPELPSITTLLQAIAPPLIVLYLVFGFAFALVQGKLKYRSAQERIEHSSWNSGWLWWPLVFWACLPPIFFFVYSYIGRSDLFFWRFYLWGAPGVALLFGMIARTISPQRARKLAFLCILLLVAVVPRRWAVENWRDASRLITERVRQNPNTHVLAYTGLIELENASWLNDANRYPYLSVPFFVYPLPKNPVLIPSGFYTENAQRYFKTVILPLLENEGSILLVSAHMTQFARPSTGDSMPEHFVELASKHGLTPQYLLQRGSVWLIEFRR